ncbi:hypothetical protein B5X24_HaOG203157 [Helicoverpa armigera]|uniref:Uncharacterized protein n=1 Tax=Helicoverpa armigera TaxID=29058 RepID=A0A2W1BTD0_HELAM|nr:hypothetical protein B5X24_HaOG203157 [Helicoverpa armigera]
MKALIVPSLTIREPFFHNRLRPFRVRGVEIITTGYRIDARLNNQTENKKTLMRKWIMQKRRRGGAPLSVMSPALIVSACFILHCCVMSVY